MSRKYLDCRNTPNEVGCTMAMAGEEQELLEAAVQHAVTVHHDEDTPELRAGLQAHWVDDPLPSPV